MMITVLRMQIVALSVWRRAGSLLYSVPTHNAPTRNTCTALLTYRELLPSHIFASRPGNQIHKIKRPLKQRMHT